MVRGFSRFVPFLFLGLLRAPTRNSPERVRDTIWTFPKKVGNPQFSFSQVIGCYSDGDSELIFCDSTLLLFAFIFASRCGISGDSRPAILGLVRFMIRDSMPLSSFQLWQAKCLNNRVWKPPGLASLNSTVEGACARYEVRVMELWDPSPTSLSDKWVYRQPVDPVVPDPVRQDNDKIWIFRVRSRGRT